MLKTTTWKPDTCECEIEYEWDDSVPQEQRTHTIKKVNKMCIHHQGKPDNECFEVVKDENTTKNRFLGVVLEIPELRKEVIDNDGNISYELKSGLKYDWSFDSKRKLQGKIIGLSISEKSSLKTIIDTKLGLNKVDMI